MKIIYKKEVKEYINGEEVNNRRKYSVHYGSLPSNSVKTYSVLDDNLIQKLKNNFFNEITIVKKFLSTKEHIEYLGRDWFNSHISFKDFNNITVKTFYTKLNDCTLAYLFNSLSAEDFVDYCKDKGTPIPTQNK